MAQPVRMGWLGVLRDEDQKIAAGQAGQVIARAAMAKLSGGNLVYSHAPLARTAHRVIARARVHHNDLERPGRLLRQHGVEHLAEQSATILDRN
jgi:hypothetical protein